MGKKLFADTFVIFYSKPDECWVAHSLRTDQFGTGDCVVDAFVDGMKAVDSVCEIARRDRSVEIFHDAPNELFEIAKNAKPLPKEVYEIAHKILYGDWPEQIQPRFEVAHSVSFVRKRMEKVG